MISKSLFHAEESSYAFRQSSIIITMVYASLCTSTSQDARSPVSYAASFDKRRVNE